MRISRFVKGFFVCGIVMFLIGLTGCPTEANNNNDQAGGALTGFRENETAIGSAMGYQNRGPVRVSIRVENGFIRFNRDFAIRGIEANYESDPSVVMTRIGATRDVRDIIERRNSFDGITRFDVDSGVGNTVTLNAVLNAGRQALANLRITED